MDEYKDLIIYTKKLAELRPWEWMPENFVFCIKEPISSEIFYCIFLGKNKKDYGLNAYKGQKGLIALIEIFNKNDNVDLFPKLNLLSIGFVKEKFLMNYDIDILEKYKIGEFKNLGFPQFSSKLIGSTYNELSLNEIKELSIVLKKSIEFSIKYKENLNEILSKNSKYDLIYRENGVWKEKKFIPTIKYKKLKLSELSIMRIKKKLNKSSKILDIGYIYLNKLSVDKENGSYFFPKVLVAVDYYSGEIIDYIIYNSRKINDLVLYYNFIEKLFYKIKNLPSDIIFSNEDLYYGFEEFCKELNIKISFDNDSKYSNDFYDNFFSKDLIKSEKDLIFNFMVEEAILEIKKIDSFNEIINNDDEN